MKITTSFENINSFSGLNFISDEYDRLNFRKIITSHLGSCSIVATYQYSDIIENIWMILFAGGDCAEDIHTNFKSELCNIMGMNVSSPDTILRLQKELCPDKEIHLIKGQVRTNKSIFFNKIISFIEQ